MLAVSLGLVAGGLFVWLAAFSRLRDIRNRNAELGAQLREQRARCEQLSNESARLNERVMAEQRASAEKQTLLEDARRQLTDAFKALSVDALKASNESFLQLAQERLALFQHDAKAELEARQKAIEQLTQPIRERLERFDGKLDDIEKSRVGAYRALSQQVQDLLQVHLPQLHRETASLVTALRQPQARGRWGEIQLRRVIEMAGMLERCDFTEQESRDTDSGRLRPDVVIRLPGEKYIVIDAKAPLDSYLQATETGDETVLTQALSAHARQVRDHMSGLGRKAYWEQFDPTPEFVVMFLPGEMFFSAALQKDPSLIEYGVNERVIPATPTTLIALLRAIAYGWRQEALARNAAEVAALGKELYDRISKLAGHWSSVGQRLNQAVEAYNQSVGSLESRVLPTARRFRDLEAVETDRDIERLTPLTQETRSSTAEELTKHPRADSEQKLRND